MPRELQEKATKDLTDELYGSERPLETPVFFQEASELPRRNYMLRLADALFPKDDAELVPAAGRELFDNVKSADVCTDPGCFRSKLDAFWLRVSADAKEMGYEVLSDKETKKVYPPNHYGDGAAYASGYVDLQQSASREVPYGSKAFGKKYAQLLKDPLKKGEIPITLTRDQSGNAQAHRGESREGGSPEARAHQAGEDLDLGRQQKLDRSESRRDEEEAPGAQRKDGPSCPRRDGRRGREAILGASEPARLPSRRGSAHL